MSPISLVQTAVECARRASGGARRESLLSLADQAVVSGVTFLTTVLLGRWCGAEELGVYALGFTIVVFSLNMQTALISIPYTNQWRRRAQADQQGFAGVALIQQLILAAMSCTVVAIVAVVLWALDASGPVGTVLFPLAACLPLILLREFARRFAFAHLRMATALAIDTVVSVLQAVGIVVLFLADCLDPATAFVALGFGAGIGSIGALAVMRQSFSIRLDLLRRAAGEHWRFGRWVLADTALITLQCYLMHWLLAFLSGTADTGVYAACVTIVLLLNPLLIGVGNVLEPKAAKTFIDGGCHRLRAMVWKASLALGAVMMLYCIAVFLAGDWIIATLYQGSEYTGQAHLLGVLAATSLIGALQLAATCGLRAMGRPEINFRATCLSTVVALIGGLAVIPHFGMLGGAYAFLLSELCGLFARNLAFVHISAPRRAAGTPPAQLFRCHESV